MTTSASGGGPTGIDGQVCLVCLGRLVCLVLCQQTDKRQTSANGKRIEENRLGFVLCLKRQYIYI